MIKTSSERVRKDIADSENSTGRKIDELSSKLTTRLSKAEKTLTQLSTQIATSREEVETLRERMNMTEKLLPDIVDAAVAKRLARTAPGRRPRSGAPEEVQASADLKESRYWEARRTLKMWPIVGDNLPTAVLNFVTSTLGCPPGRLTESDFTATRALSRPGSLVQNQVLVRFRTASLRDEIKSLGKKLGGSDQGTGMQLDPPDFLRSHYQIFQKLAYHLKKKNPSLRRNITFCDASLSLTMDVLARPGKVEDSPH